MGLNYDGLVFHPVPRDSGVEHTTGRYHQDGVLVWAEITGPDVRIGRLVGTVGPDGTLEAAYAQVMANGQVVAGRVVSRPAVRPDSRVRLTEHWQRMDGSSGVSRIDSEAPPTR